jgi:NDP-sugar pyrophosphorylase family protein
LQNGEIVLKGNITIGRNCRIEKGTMIENCHIGHTSLIERNVEIKNSVIMSFGNVRRDVFINKAIIGRHSTIEAHCILNGDQPRRNHRIPVIGENVTLPRESVVGSGIRVAPLKHSHNILATGRFVETGIDDRNFYFTEKSG